MQQMNFCLAGMGFTCCVPGCYNRSSKSSLLAFHRFPRNLKLQKQWVTAINRKDPDSSKLFQYDYKTHRVCSEHFEGGKKLKDSVPSLFPLKKTNPVKLRSTHTSKRASKPLSPTKEELRQEKILAGILVPHIGATEEVQVQLYPDKPIPLKTVNSTSDLLKVSDDNSPTLCDHTYCKTDILRPLAPNVLNRTFNDLFTTMQSLSAAKAEVRTLKSRSMDSEVIKRDTSALNLYTGFKHPKHYQALIDFLQPDFNHLQFPGEKIIKLSPENCILMTLTKYKLDTPQDDLAYRLVSFSA